MKKRLTVLSVALLGLLLMTAQASAALYPWLDFGDSFTWDGSSVYTDKASPSYEYVTSVTYKDGTTASPFPVLTDAVLGSEVSLNILFDGINDENDTLTVDGWFTANVIITSSVFDPIAGKPNPFKAWLDNIDWTCGDCSGSRWYDEFSPITANPLNPYDAMLLLDFSTAADNGDGTYNINGGGKVAPVPEPGTLLLLGFGLVGLSFFRRKRKVIV